MYLTPSQNYTSSGGGNPNPASRTSQALKHFSKQKTGNHGPNVTGSMTSKVVGTSPAGGLNKKISYDNSFNVQKIKQQVAPGHLNANRSPVINGNNISYKVKTETDWHRGS